MKLINLLPHAVTIRTVRSGDIILPGRSPGDCPYLDARGTRTLLPDIESGRDLFPLAREPIYAVMGLPGPRDGVLYVVSTLIAEACPHRDDLVSPGPAFRDDEGNVEAHQGLLAGPGLAMAVSP